MKKRYEKMDEGLRTYKMKRYEVRRQLVPPIVFFVAVALIILVSVVKHHQKIESGGTEMTADAIRVDYMSASVGLDIFQNTDELDDSYGDYFYLGADFYQVGKPIIIDVAGHKGIVVFEGKDTVDSFCWVCLDTSFSQEEVETLVNDLTAAFGDYEQGDDGVYTWYASEDGRLGNNDKLAWLSCGYNRHGKLVIEGGALES